MYAVLVCFIFLLIYAVPSPPDVGDQYRQFSSISRSTVEVDYDFLCKSSLLNILQNIFKQLLCLRHAVYPLPVLRRHSILSFFDMCKIAYFSLCNTHHGHDIFLHLTIFISYPLQFAHCNACLLVACSIQKTLIILL